jgi:hypothetical protein
MFVIPDHIQFNPNLSTNLKSFIRALAHHCGDKNTCWPSQERIAQFMNCSPRTVRRMERQAVELQFISVKRRWLKTNVYTVHVLEERGQSTMRTERSPIEQTTLSDKNVRTASNPQPEEWKSPAEIKLLIEDMTEVFGEDVGERNAGWFYRIAKMVKESVIYEALSWIRQAIMESDYSGYAIQSSSALFTWYLRNHGAQI